MRKIPEKMQMTNPMAKLERATPASLRIVLASAPSESEKNKTKHHDGGAGN